MDSVFFSDWQSLLRITISSVLGYIALVVILRISGKRSLSKMNSFDFIVTIAIGSTLATVILDKSLSLAEGILAFGLLILLQFIITYFSARSKSVSNWIKSSPTLMAYNGELLKENMLAERIDEDEVWAVLREKGYSSLNEASAVVLETNGSLTVIDEVKDIKAAPMQNVLI